MEEVEEGGQEIAVPTVGLTFPYDVNAPSRGSEPRLIALVPFDIASEFFLPEGRTGLGDARRPTAFVSVPEASVNEDHGRPRRQDDVGSSREALVVKSEAKTVSVEGGSDDAFGSRVPGLDLAHQGASECRDRRLLSRVRLVDGVVLHERASR